MPRNRNKQQPLSRARRRLFTLITLALPVLAIVLLELLLRVFHYGPDLSLFLPHEVNGKTYYFVNPEVKSRYFSQIDFSPVVSLDFFTVPKPERTFRIFCLGGSTTAGYPYWVNGSFSSFLRDRLRRIFPARRIEVVNVGMTATNSFTVLDMARDIMRYEPDLLVVYDGHNEFYGALGTASRETMGASRWLKNLSLRLLSLRTFVLLRAGAARISQLFGGSPVGEPATTMMEQLARGHAVPYRGRTYQEALESFAANMHDLRDECVSHSVPVILSTQVCNLRDFPPFIQAERSDDFAGGPAGLARALNSGKELMRQGHFSEALTTLRGALGFDSLNAESMYEIARCQDTLGMKAIARESYALARDYDQLRFRTSSDFNRAILAAADRPGISAIDAEEVFMSSSPDSLIGSTLIFEHLHPRARGYFLLAKSYVEKMRKQGILASPKEWSAADTLDEEALWADRPVTDLDEVCANRRTEILTSRWPFVRKTLTIHPASDALGTIADRMITGKMTWEQAHAAAVDYYMSRNEFLEAIREARAMLNQVPLDARGYVRLARIYSFINQTEVAERYCLQSLEVERTAAAYRILGKLANNSRRFDDAIQYFLNAIALGATGPEAVEDHYNLALAYMNARDIQHAIAQLEQVVRQAPEFAAARTLLQRLKGRR